MKKMTRIYEGLNSGERARLAFASMVRGDSNDSRRLTETAPFMRFRGPDRAYTRAVDALFGLSSCYGIEYWKRRFLREQGALKGIISGSDETLEAAHMNYMELVLFQRALAAVCDRHGIDIEDVMRLSGAELMDEEMLNEAVEDGGLFKKAVELQEMKEQELEQIIEALNG